MNFFLAFIALEKAYDSVLRSNLWKSMADMEIMEQYCTDIVVYVKIGNDISEFQEALDKVAVFLQFYLIFIRKKLWTIGRRAAKEWECK